MDFFKRICPIGSDTSPPATLFLSVCSISYRAGHARNFVTKFSQQKGKGASFNPRLVSFKFRSSWMFETSSDGDGFVESLDLEFTWLRFCAFSLRYIFPFSSDTSYLLHPP